MAQSWKGYYHEPTCPPTCTHRKSCINHRYNKSPEGKRLGRESSKRQARELREEVIIFLGGRCVRQHVENDPLATDVRCLQIDHINGGGFQERKKLGNRGLLKRVLQNPTEYQLLCACHNWIKRVENGETVHAQDS